MRIPAVLPAASLLGGFLLAGCGNTPANLPGKIAFVSNQFPQTGKPGSNYGIFVWEKGKVRPFYQGGDQPQWDATGGRLFCGLTGGGGGKIAVLNYPSGELLETIQLKRYFGSYVFSKDGRYLVYAGWERSEEPENPDKPRPKNLFIYELKTQVEEQITSFTEHWRDVSLSSLDISRDGKTIAFYRGDPEDRYEDGSRKPHVYLLDLETRKIADLGSGDSPRFLPTEDALVYTTHEINGERFVAGPGEDSHGEPLYTIDLARYHLKTGQRGRLTHNERFTVERGSSFSPDGRHFVSAVMVFGAGWEGRGIRLFKSDGTQLRNLIGYDGHDYQDPDWGP